jgi:hypothetical protein
MIDPEITAASDQCNRQGTKLTEDMFAHVAGKPEFVNRLEICVRTWLREIARVTQMEYDLASGSVL